MRSLPAAWDGVELWLSTVAFPLQVTVVLAVFIPLAYGLGRVVTAVTDAVVNKRVVGVLRGRDDEVEEEI